MDVMLCLCSRQETIKAGIRLEQPFQGQSRVSHKIQVTEDMLTETVMVEVLTEKHYRLT